MTVMAVCGALLFAGLAAGAMWSGRTFYAPAAEGELSATDVARRFVWYCTLAIVAGVGAGISVIGAGGRLAMRLLAVTGGDEAQRRTTEAGATVGEITSGGTIFFILFIGILSGVGVAALYLVVRRLLPPGWLGGVVFGLGLLVVVGTTLDPLRDENPDFDIVGPGWLAVVVFTVLAVALGVVLAALAARLSVWLPLLSTQRRVLVRYAGPAALAAVAFTVTWVLVVVGLAVVAVTRWRQLVDAMRSPRAIVVGRVVALGLVVLALPNALTSVADIASR